VDVLWGVIRPSEMVFMRPYKTEGS